MVITACHCNFGIAGVDRLPAHDHNAERLVADMVAMNPDNPLTAEIVDRMVLRDSVHIWVDWKAVARPNPNASPAPAAP